MSSLAGGIPALAQGIARFQQQHPRVVLELRALDAEDGLAYDYQRGAARFAVRSEIHDVGMVRPPHSWSFSS